MAMAFVDKINNVNKIFTGASWFHARIEIRHLPAFSIQSLMILQLLSLFLLSYVQ